MSSFNHIKIKIYNLDKEKKNKTPLINLTRSKNKKAMIQKKKNYDFPKISKIRKLGGGCQDILK